MAGNLDFTPWALERAERFMIHSEAVGGDYGEHRIER